MPTNDEVAAWLDLAEYARELSDALRAQPSKQTMLGIARLCETLAYRYHHRCADNPAENDHILTDV
jgi:hypothetical protein